MNKKIILKLFGFLFLCMIFFTLPLQISADGSFIKDSNKTGQAIQFPEERIKKSELTNPQVQIIETPPKLAEIVAFHIALIAFFIPLSVDMVGRISERYGSSVISKYYKRERIPWLIFILSTLNILISVLLIFFSNSIKFLDFVSLTIFVITLGLIPFYLVTLYRYLTNIDWMIEKLTQDVKNLI